MIQSILTIITTSIVHNLLHFHFSIFNAPHITNTAMTKINTADRLGTAANIELTIFKISGWLRIAFKMVNIRN